MLRFVTAGESHGQALLAFISGLPASLPVDLDFINHELHRRQLGYGRGGRQKLKKTAPISSPECATARPSVLPWRYASKTATGPIGKKLSPLKIPPILPGKTRSSSRRAPATPTLPARKNLTFTTPATFSSAPLLAKLPLA